MLLQLFAYRSIWSSKVTAKGQVQSVLDRMQYTERLPWPSGTDVLGRGDRRYDAGSNWNTLPWLVEGVYLWLHVSERSQQSRGLWFDPALMYYVEHMSQRLPLEFQKKCLLWIRTKCSCSGFINHPWKFGKCSPALCGVTFSRINSLRLPLYRQIISRHSPGIIQSPRESNRRKTRSAYVTETSIYQMD